MNLRVPKMRGNSWLAAEPVSFSRRTLLHGVSKYFTTPGTTNKTSSICSNTGTSKQHFKPNVVHKFSTTKYTMHWLSPFFKMEAKFGPLEKTDKKRLTSIVRKNFRRRAGCTLFDHKKWRNFGRVESRNSWRETNKIQIKLATACNRNGQQQDGKNSAEL